MSNKNFAMLLKLSAFAFVSIGSVAASGGQQTTYPYTVFDDADLIEEEIVPTDSTHATITDAFSNTYTTYNSPYLYYHPGSGHYSNTSQSGYLPTSSTYSTYTSTSRTVYAAPVIVTGGTAGASADASALAALPADGTQGQVSGVFNSTGNQTIAAPLVATAPATFKANTGIINTFNAPLASTSLIPITFEGGGNAITTPNPNLTGPVNVTGSALSLSNGANLGTGQLNLTSVGGTPVTLNLGANLGDVITLNNQFNLNDSAAVSAANPTQVVVPTGAQATLAGPIVGTAQLKFTGAGKTILSDTSGNSANYSGTLNVASGTLVPTGDYSKAEVALNSGAILGMSGTLGKVGAVTLSIGSNVHGTLPTDRLSAKSWSNDGVTYNTPVSNTGGASGVTVTDNATVTNPTFNILMTHGTYPRGVIDYNVLQAGGTLTVTGTVTLNWVNPAHGDGGVINPITCTIGTLTKTTSGVLTNYLVVKETLADAVTVGADQAAADVNQTATFTAPLTNVTIASTDTVSAGSGLRPDAAPESAPVADIQEQTSIVFQSNSDNITSAATADAFRFNGFSAGKTAVVSSKKDAIENLLTAISKNGPISVERNETRLWITPYANRSRTNRTSSSAGNQGWSGGSLVGLEQRDKKNVWSLGLLTGLMGSRSHVLGTPDTFSKTNGFLIGAYNTYKYTNYKDAGNFGHELLISRTTTSIDAQRYGLDKVNKITPYYALSSYKSTTDVGNAQLNYLFDIIKKEITCRLSTGLTYSGTNYGSYNEKNAGTNGLNQSNSSNKSVEFYNGIGLRKIWNYEKITIRTTAVYDYGYQMTSSGTVAKTTTQSLSPTTYSGTVGPRQNKHYLQLSSSYLDRETGLKFIMSYSGILYKNVQNHTGMFKVEYRF